MGPFTGADLPAGLRRNHRIAERTWGRLRVLEGAVEFEMATSPAVRVEIVAGGSQVIPPAVTHALGLVGPVTLEIDFLVRDEPQRGFS